MRPEIIDEEIQCACFYQFYDFSKKNFFDFLKTRFYKKIKIEKKTVPSQMMRMTEHSRVRNPTATSMTSIRPTASLTISFLKPRN